MCYTGGTCTGGDMYGCRMAVALRLQCAIPKVGVRLGICIGVTWL